MTNELMALKGTALAVAGTVGGVAAVGFAAYELNKHFAALAEKPHQIDLAFQDLNGELHVWRRAPEGE